MKDKKKSKFKMYDTVSEAVNDMVKRGYTENFVVKNKTLYCHEKNVSLNPDEFNIDELFRFEGNTDPADETVVYAIAALHHSIKGILVSAYGAQSAPKDDEMIKQLKNGIQ